MSSIYEKLDQILSELEKNKSKAIEINIEDEDPVFNRKRNYYIAISFAITVILAIISINWILPIVPYTFAALTTVIGIAFKIWYDKIIFKGDTIARQAKNAIAYAIGGLEFAFYFGVGFVLGFSYITNPFGGENEPSQKIQIERPAATTIQEEPRQQLDTASRSNGTVLPERAGKPQREQ